MLCFCTLCCFFFSFLFNATPTTDIYTLSLHDALPISFFFGKGQCASCHMISGAGAAIGPDLSNVGREMTVDEIQDRKSTRLNSSHTVISYAVFCLKKKKKNKTQ